jgi:hypothetical protein
MKLWIDLANSPQVLFFRPIIQELKRQGHEVVITSRNYAQTVPLANKIQLSHTIIGRHGGRGSGALISQLLLRSSALARWARSRKLDIAVSHNSYSQVLSARLLSIPVVTLMDYEHQPLNHLAFRLAQRVIVPRVFPEEALSRFGAHKKAYTYDGLKEQVYLTDFAPQPDFREQEGLPIDRRLVVVRPPAPWTAYHHLQNDLFDQLLALLAIDESNYVLFLPRLESQAKSFSHIPQIHIADKVYDGPNLLYHADLAISGGGTMNREAAVLGTPVFTVFKGKLGAVDKHLIELGRMKQLVELDEFRQWSSAFHPLDNMLNSDLVSHVTDLITGAH